jgi:hypothetical protein
MADIVIPYSSTWIHPGLCYYLADCIEQVFIPMRLAHN